MALKGNNSRRNIISTIVFVAFATVYLDYTKKISLKSLFEEKKNAESEFYHKKMFTAHSGPCDMVLSSYVWISSEKRNDRSHLGQLNLFCQFLKGAILSSSKIRLVGWTSQGGFGKSGFLSKILAANRLAKSLQPETVLYMIDAFDVLVQDKIDCMRTKRILKTSFPGKMVFAGEAKCYPLYRKKYAGGKACFDYPESPLGEWTRYLNGGSWVGLAGDVSIVTSEFIRQQRAWDKSYFHKEAYERIVRFLPTLRSKAGDDQYGMAVMMLYGKEKHIAIDTKGELLTTSPGFMYQRGHKRFIRGSDGLMFDTVGNSTPSIIHFNAGKEYFTDAIKTMPWIGADVSRARIEVGPEEDGSYDTFIYDDLCK